MSLSHKSILAQTTSTANLTDHNMRVLRATINSKPASDAQFLSNTVKAVAEEMNLKRVDALELLQSYIEMELKAEDSAIADHWERNLPASSVVHEGTTSRAERNAVVNFH